MAITTVKSTYALDVETVRALENMARRWNVSKSEALRRAIRAAARDLDDPGGAIAALNSLQRSLGLSASQTQRWARGTRAERRASSSRADRRAT